MQGGSVMNRQPFVARERTEGRTPRNRGSLASPAALHCFQSGRYCTGAGDTQPERAVLAVHHWSDEKTSNFIVLRPPFAPVLRKISAIFVRFSDLFCPVLGANHLPTGLRMITLEARRSWLSHQQLDFPPTDQSLPGESFFFRLYSKEARYVRQPRRCRVYRATVC